MYGILAVDLATSDYLNFPLFGSHSPALTQMVGRLFTWDRFISAGVAANLIALLFVAFVAVRGSIHATLTGAVVRANVRIVR
jgi:hypothetical protein